MAKGYPGEHKKIAYKTFHLHKTYPDEITGARRFYMPFCSMECINGVAFPGDLVRVRKSPAIHSQHATNCMAVKAQAFADQVEVSTQWQEALYLGLDIERSFYLYDYNNVLKIATGKDYTGFIAMHVNASYMLELVLVKCNQETMQTMWREPVVAITGTLNPPPVGYAPYVYLVENFYYLPKKGLSALEHKKRHMVVDYYFNFVKKARAKHG